MLSLQQFHDDFKEVRTDLMPSKDLLNIYQPNYTLRWKLEDEESEDDEKVVSEVQPVNRLQFLNVSLIIENFLLLKINYLK